MTVVLMLAIVWRTGIEPRLTDEVQVSAVLLGLPAEWSGTRVALIADLQLGMWLANTDTVRQIVTRAVAERPAALLIAGDFLYHPTDESGEPRQARAELEPEDRRTFLRQIAEAVALLQPLADAGIRTIAVLGNHDYAMRVPTAVALAVVADDLAQALRDAGVIVLRNEAVPLGGRDAHRAPTQRLFVAGLDAWFPRATDVAAALKQVPEQAPGLWLMHNPDSFRQLPAGSAPVALGAHTHGGQIRVPLLPHWSWMSGEGVAGRHRRRDRAGIWCGRQSTLCKSRHRLQHGATAHQLPTRTDVGDARGELTVNACNNDVPSRGSAGPDSGSVAVPHIEVSN